MFACLPRLLGEVEVVGFASSDLSRGRANGVAVPDVDVARPLTCGVSGTSGCILGVHSEYLSSPRSSMSARTACLQRLPHVPQRCGTLSGVENWMPSTSKHCHNRSRQRSGLLRPSHASEMGAARPDISEIGRLPLTETKEGEVGFLLGPRAVEQAAPLC